MRDRRADVAAGARGGARFGLIVLGFLLAAVVPGAVRSQDTDQEAVVIEVTDGGAIEVELSAGERLLLVGLDATDLEIKAGSRLLLREEAEDEGGTIVVVRLAATNAEVPDDGRMLRARLARADREWDARLFEIETLAEPEAEMPEAHGPGPMVGPSQALPTLSILTSVPTFTSEPSPLPEATPVAGTPVPTSESTPVLGTRVPTLRPACDPSYPDFCIPPSPPDLDCSDFTQKNFRVLPPDLHNLDGDGDGIGCAATSTVVPQASSTPTATRTLAPTSTRTITPISLPVPTATSKPACDPSYPDFCIPPPPPDLDCKDFPQKRFTVRQPDPHRLDSDKNGIGCES